MNTCVYLPLDYSILVSSERYVIRAFLLNAMLIKHCNNLLVEVFVLITLFSQSRQGNLFASFLQITPNLRDVRGIKKLCLIRKHVLFP